MYRPNDELGRHLIQSIPQKINAWLAAHGLNISEVLDIGSIKWVSSDDFASGSMVFDGITIEWSEGSIYKASEKYFENLSENLKTFVDFETRVYAEVEKFLASRTPNE